MEQNQVRFLLTSPLVSNTDIGEHLNKHGDGVKDISLTVDNAEEAWKKQ